MSAEKQLDKIMAIVSENNNHVDFQTIACSNAARPWFLARWWSTKSIVAVMLLTGVLLSLSTVGKGMLNPQSLQHSLFLQSSKPPDSILTVVRNEAVQIRISASGSVTPEREVKISPKQAGLLKSLYVNQGDYVKKGQLIALMDDSNIRGQLYSQAAAYRAARENYLKLKRGNRPQEVAQRKAACEQAASTVRAAEINIRKLEVQLESQLATAQKDSELARRDGILAREGAASDQDYLKSRTQSEVSMAQSRVCREEIAVGKETLAQSISSLKQQKEQLELVQIGFRDEEINNALQSAEQQKGAMNYYETLEEDTRIRAPFDGQITQKYADGGSYVTPAVAASTDSATSSSIVVLAGRLEVVAQVPESTIESIRSGQEVEIVANAIRKAIFHGVVRQIAPAAVTSSNVTVFKVHIRLDDEACRRLRSGMNVTTTFLCGRADNARVIPAVCVVTRDGKRGVYVAGADGHPQFKEVQLDAYLGENVVVAAGLDVGEKVFKGLSDEELVKLGFNNSPRPPFPGGPPH